MSKMTTPCFIFALLSVNFGWAEKNKRLSIEMTPPVKGMTQ